MRRSAILSSASRPPPLSSGASPAVTLQQQQQQHMHVPSSSTARPTPTYNNAAAAASSFSSAPTGASPSGMVEFRCLFSTQLMKKRKTWQDVSVMSQLHRYFCNGSCVCTVTSRGCCESSPLHGDVRLYELQAAMRGAPMTSAALGASVGCLWRRGARRWTAGTCPSRSSGACWERISMRLNLKTVSSP